MPLVTVGLINQPRQASPSKDVSVRMAAPTAGSNRNLQQLNV